MAGIKIVGLDKLQSKLKKNITLEDVKKVVKKNGSDLQKKAQRNAEFNKGYQTGETKRSIGIEISDGGMTSSSEPTTEYASYPEYGTRFMEAQPYMRPAYNEQKEKFKSDMRRLTK